MAGFSPGLIQGCFELLDIASEYALSFPKLVSSFPHFAGLPTKDVTALAQRLRWLEADPNGIAVLTPDGAQLQLLKGYEPKLRQALLDYLELESPPWLQNALAGRARVLTYASSDVAQVFAEAGLTGEPTVDVVEFWDTVGALARGLKMDRLTRIGRQGEQLTLVHERRRTNREPRWIAIENNDDGYDVLSVVSKRNPRSLSIEVKASNLGLNGSLFLTRNEWERCVEMPGHVFHLWVLKDQPALAVVPAQEMRKHIPADRGHGTWNNVQVPFAAFAASFAPAKP